MNPEICKKCHRKPKYYYVQNIVPIKLCNEKFMVLIGISPGERERPCTIVTDDKNFIEECCDYHLYHVADEFYSGIPSSIPFHNRNFRVSEISCPYWVEHQIYDWNKR